MDKYDELDKVFKLFVKPEMDKYDELDKLFKLVNIVLLVVVKLDILVVCPLINNVDELENVFRLFVKPDKDKYDELDKVFKLFVNPDMDKYDELDKVLTLLNIVVLVAFKLDIFKVEFVDSEFKFVFILDKPVFPNAEFVERQFKLFNKVVLVALRLFIFVFILDKLVLLLLKYSDTSIPPTFNFDMTVVSLHNIL